MSTSCALQFAKNFAEDIDKLPQFVVFVAPHTVEAISAFDEEKPKNSISDIATNLENCTKEKIENSFTLNARLLAEILVSILIITILVIVGFALILSQKISRLNIFLFVSLVIITILSLYRIYIKSLRIFNTNLKSNLSENIGSCVYNGSRSLTIYENQLDNAIQRGLCSY